MTVLDRFRLDDKVAIVTGASSGLGAAFAVALAQAGADVVLGARRVDRMAAVAADVQACGRRSMAHATDVSNPAQCGALVQAALDGFGRVDILVNNAGVSTAAPTTPRGPGGLPTGRGRQPERRLLDGPSVRPRHETGQHHHHQHRQCARLPPPTADSHRPPTINEDRDHRTDPRSSPSNGAAARASASTISHLATSPPR